MTPDDKYKREQEIQRARAVAQVFEGGQLEQAAENVRQFYIARMLDVGQTDETVLEYRTRVHNLARVMRDLEVAIRTGNDAKQQLQEAEDYGSH